MNINTSLPFPLQIISRWNCFLWDANNIVAWLSHATCQIPTRYTKLYIGDRKLWLSSRRCKPEFIRRKRWTSRNRCWKYQLGTDYGFQWYWNAIHVTSKVFTKSWSSVILNLQQFTIIGYEFNHRMMDFATGFYPRLSLRFTLKRNIEYFILQTYMPCALVTMLRYRI